MGSIHVNFKIEAKLEALKEQWGFTHIYEVIERLLKETDNLWQTNKVIYLNPAKPATRMAIHSRKSTDKVGVMIVMTPIVIGKRWTAHESSSRPNQFGPRVAHVY